MDVSKCFFASGKHFDTSLPVGAEGHHKSIMATENIDDIQTEAPPLLRGIHSV